MSKKLIPIMDALIKANPKAQLFQSNQSLTSYKTGYMIMDYKLGFRTNVYNPDTDECIGDYPSLGVADGCFIYLIGKSSTGKTALAVQMAANIVRPYENGVVLHYDLEGAYNITRVQQLTRFSISDIYNKKYNLYQKEDTINSIKKTIFKIYEEKVVNNPSLYAYDTGLKDEFGQPKIGIQPTCVIIDSIPHLVGDDGLKEEEVSSQTARMRLTAEISRFYTELLPKIKAANIIVISINHIKTNPGMGVMPTPSELIYLKQNESLPGGKGPVYVANYMLKLVAPGAGKHTKEKDGFDGFDVEFDIVKSRTNKTSFKAFTLVYEMERGFSPVRSAVNYAKQLGIVSGNRNGYYLNGDKDHKFTLENMDDDFHNDKILYKNLYDSIRDSLNESLSSIKSSDLEIDNELYDY